MNAVDTGHDAVHGALRARVEARRWRREAGGGTRWAAAAGAGLWLVARLEVLEVCVEELLEAGALHLDRNRRALIHGAVHL